MLSSLAHLIRYRFLLFAGLIPFALGQAIAWQDLHTFDIRIFFIALAGIAFVLVGVEAFNEYFDAKIGTDRVFSLETKDVPRRTFFLGLGSFTAAFCVMIFFTWRLGWPIAVFSMAGAIAACFYVTPPVKLAYRGLGEVAILISYGPMMTAGSYFIQTGRIDVSPFVASVVPALLILCVTIMNEVPDFYGDRIVGKRNITVRLGRQGVIWLYAAASAVCLVFIVAASIFGLMPRFAIFALVPLLLAPRNFLIARRNIDSPQGFIPAIRGAVIVYSLSVAVLAVAYLIAIP